MVSRVALIGAAGLLTYGAWLIYRQAQEEANALEDLAEGFDGITESAGGVINDTAQTAAEAVDSLTGGILRISNMSRVTPADLAHPNVQALLRVIRRGEGTAGPDGYRTLFGGGLFSSFADHPRITVRKSGYTSTAAGAYQFLSSTWDETKRVMGLPDFSPASQDLAAVGRIAARGALADVKAGNFEAAIRKIGREWASMPGSPYGQPVISWETARTVYASAGGNILTA